ncbi:FtsX-like permease family protein [uncultured Parolsenella sp.]|uniref:FtsX-like permease family protein n=1 Tax=uncultured Parolsenella sp. TaxID=2083008 RepID=UPI0027D96E3E|nr:FtsX-like permease family protein [uncultured Parolsenella sp.]
MGRRSAFALGTLRTIRGSLRRFLSIAAICLLGTTMLVGLKVACDDLRISADAFFDAQSLYDVSVQSTLGLTSDDVTALAALEGVETAEGSWVETAYTNVGDARSSVTVRTLMASGMNEPYVVEGRLPQAADEAAVTEEYLEESGKAIGDETTFSKGGTDTDTADGEQFSEGPYTIVGTVIDPASVSAKHGSSSFRSTGPLFTFFVTPGAVNPDVADTFSVIYLRVIGANDLSGFSDAYASAVARVTDEAEAIKDERERARGDEVRAKANEAVDEAEAEANAELADAESQLSDAQGQIDDARTQIAEGRERLKAERASATSQLDAAQEELTRAAARLDQSERELSVNEAQVIAGEEQARQASARLDAAQAALDERRAAIQAALEQAATAGQATTAPGQPTTARQPQAEQGAASPGQPVTSPNPQTGQTATTAQPPQTGQPATSPNPQTGQAALEQLREAQAQLDAQRAQLDATVKQLAEARARLASARSKLEQGRSELVQGQAELDARRKLAEGQLADGAAQLDAAETEADDGQAALDANLADYERQKADALAKIADARADAAAIENPVWYVQDRSAISSFASIDSDASSIEVIGTVFPAIFLTVAILVALTTAARMVEEERGLIGLYKALGYRRRTIMAKYVAYTALAALVGSGLGALLGFVALPEFLFTVFRVMYTLPQFQLSFDPALCALAVGMFVVGIGVATALSVRGELAEQPASLMRPKAPHAGTRILLERVTPVWSRLSFLGKVCARNLFRYKRRLAMTVFGVAGCCALMISGFAIADTVLALSPNQYGDAGRAGVYEYDLMAVSQPGDLGHVTDTLASSDEVADFVPVRTESVTVEHDGLKETVQLMVVPDGHSLDGYVDLRTQDGQHLSLAEATGSGDNATDVAPSALVTKNASVVLGFSAGDDVTVQDATLNQTDVRVASVVMNYLGNVVYMTQDAYETAFGVALEPNAALAHLNGSADEQISFAHKLAEDPALLQVTSVEEGVRDFSANFMLINYVVALITTLAAGLSFVVLFTLSTTNISERERELATLKVLGFRRHEIRTYVNRELLILAGMGTVCGIPLGTAMAHALTYVLNMPSMYFAVEIAPMSYVWSCGLSMLFAVVTCAITNRSLEQVDMVGALKSAE